MLFNVVFNNNVKALIQPVDSHSHICGVSEEALDKHSLFFTELQSVTDGWCVDACPTDRRHCVCLSSDPISNNSQECLAKNCSNFDITSDKSFKNVFNYCYPPTPPTPKWAELFKAKYDSSSFALSLTSRGWVVILSYVIPVVLGVILVMLTAYAVKGLSYLMVVVSIITIYVLGVGFVIIGIAFFSCGDKLREINGLPTVLIGIFLLILGIYCLCLYITFFYLYRCCYNINGI
jgi:hypothetical protein